MNVTEHAGEALRYLAIEPAGFDAGRPYPMVILLHGFGSHMGDLAGLCPSIDSTGYVYVCPNAPTSMDIGFGSTGYAWTVPPEGAPEALASVQSTLSTFMREVLDRYEVAPGQAVLGGFSQGGMLTYLFGLTRPETFAGLAALSAWIPDPDGLKERLPESRAQAVFISHGTADTMLPIESARRSRAFLEGEGYSPLYCEYDMAHEIRPEVVSDLRGWLNGVLPPSEPKSK